MNCIGDSSGVCPPLMDAAQSEDCGGCLGNDLCGAVVGCVRTFIDPNVCSAAACPLGHDAAAAGTPEAADCGGQVYTECGSSCPRVCGQPMGACNMMCWQGFACPSGLAFNTETGQCEDDSCVPSGGGGGMIGIGRPFMSAMAAKEDEYPTAEFAKGEEPQETAEFAILAHAVEMLSDWNAEL